MDHSDVLVEKGTPSALSEGRAGTKREHSRILRLSVPRLRGRTSKYPLGHRQISFSSIVVSILIFSFLLRLTTFCKFQWRGGGVSGGFKDRLSGSNVPRRLVDDGLGGGGLDGQCMRLLGSENEGSAGTGEGRGNDPRERLNDGGNDVWVRRADGQGFVSGSSGSRPSCEGEQQMELELRILPSGGGNEDGEPREEGPASNLGGEPQQGTSSSTGNTQSTNDNGPYGEAPPSYEEAVGRVGTLGAYRIPCSGTPPRDPPSYLDVLTSDQAGIFIPGPYMGSYVHGENWYTNELQTNPFLLNPISSPQAGPQSLGSARIRIQRFIKEFSRLVEFVCAALILSLIIFILVHISTSVPDVSTTTATTTLLKTTSTPTTSAPNSTT